MKQKILYLLIVITAISCSTKGEKQALPTFQTKTMYINASGGLRMRSTPNLQGQKVLTIPNNSKVTVLEEKGGIINLAGRNGKWSKIDYSGKLGWVFGGFLEASKPVDIDSLKIILAKKLNKNKNNIQLKVLNNVALVTTVEASPPDGELQKNYRYFCRKDNNWEILGGVWQGGVAKLLYINNDSYPDIITNGGCCGWESIQVNLVTSSCTENEVFNETGGDEGTQGMGDPIPVLQSTGKCNKTQIMIGNKLYKFNCNSNKME